MGEFAYHTVSSARGYDAIGPGKGFADWVDDRHLEYPRHVVWPRSPIPAASAAVRLNKQPGQIVCIESGAFRRDSVLWISNSAFEPIGFDHEWLEIRVPQAGTYKSDFWVRLTAGNIANAAAIRGKPELAAADLAPALAAGTLYLRTPRPKPSAIICQLTLVTKEPAPAEINACLNPLILAFNNRAVEPADDGGTPLPDDFAEFREDPYLLDIQPAFQPDDLPRARLLAEVHRRKSLAGAVGPNAPAIPRLLFGPNEAVGVLPFLMLDAFRGTFVLDGLSSGAAGWNWYPPSGRPDADNRWLIQHSLARLGIPMGEGYDGAALAGKEAEKEARRKGDTIQWSEPLDVRASLQAAQLPDAVIELCDELPEPLQQKVSGSMNGERMFTFALRENLGAILLPESTIRVRFPEPPAAWIGDATFRLWAQTRERLQLDMRETPLAAGAWWLKYLDSADPVRDEPTVGWHVGAGWHWRFYVSLFRRQPGYRVEWLQPLDKAGLGRAESPLGRLVLGRETTEANQNYFHGPDRFQLLAEGPE